MRRSIASVFSILLSVFCVTATQADSLSSSNYSVYEKTISGVTYLYIVPKETTVILHAMFPIPATIMPDVPGIKLVLDSTGPVTSAETFELNADELEAEGGYTLAPYTLSNDDVNSDGEGDLVLEHQSNGSEVQVVVNESGPAIYSQEIVVSPLNGGPEAFQQPDHDPTVGATGSQQDVGGDGSANYTIPITLPAGLGGIQPGLSLAYNSNAANGMMGVGWQMGGLSAIHRCSTTLERDGYLDPVDFDSNDQLCLDGQRLINVGGDEYRTEMESYTKIVAHGSAGTSGGPEHFEVWTRDGKILRYGYAGQSRILAQGRSDVYIWALYSVEDRYGNGMTISYEREIDHVEYRPVLIEYSQNSNTGDGPFNSVVFEYEDRPDVQHHNAAGSLLKGTKRLTNIKSYSGTEELRDYQLAYTLNATTGQSQLSSVTECAGGACLPSTVFDWQAVGYGFYGSRPAMAGSALARDNTRNFVDVNGDGRDDMVWVPSGVNNILKVAYSNGDGFDSAFTALGVSVAEGAGPSSAGGAWTQYVDVTGDGLVDMVYRPDGRNDIWVAESNGNSFDDPELWLGTDAAGGQPSYSEAGSRETYTDLNGDGLADKLWVPYGQNDVWGALSNGSAFHSAKPWLNSTISLMAFSSGGVHTKYVDVNGDGMTDMVWVPKDKTELWVALSNGESFEPPYRAFSSDSNGAGFLPFSTDGKYTSFADVNGDGLVDYVWKPKGLPGIRVAVNSGVTFRFPTLWQSGSTTSYGYINEYSLNGARESLIDINGDGMADKLWVPDGRLETWVALSNGTAFETPTVLLEPTSAGKTTKADDPKNESYADINGDGVLDKVLIPSGETTLWYLPALPADNKLLKITNGFDVVTWFYYTLLTDSTVYTKDNVSSYPVQDLQPPQYVVSQMTNSNGIDGVFTSSYTYAGLKRHATGRGSLGFASMEEHNHDIDVRTSTKYSQDYVNRTEGALVTVTKTPSSGNWSSLTKNVWLSVPRSSGDQVRYSRQLAATDVTKRDTNGEFLSREVSDYTYNDHDSVIGISSRNFDNSNNLLRTTVTTNVYADNISNWLIGLLWQSTVDTQVMGKSSQRKVSGWDFESNTGRLLKEKIYDQTITTVIHEIRYEDADSYGNHRRTVVSGPDFATRQSTTAYDSSGRYVISQTNDLGHTAYSDYYPDGHINAGQLKSSTSINGIENRYYYDVFGRAIQGIAGFNTANPLTNYTSYEWCEAGCGIGNKYSLTKSTQGGAASITDIDQLGRVVLESVQRMDGRFAHIARQYDTKGQNYKVSEPYFDGSGTMYWTTINHDALGRAERIEHPNGSVDNVTYNGLVITYRNDLNGEDQKKVETRDTLGNLVSVMDNVFNSVTYDYDSAGNMTNIVDSQGNLTTIAYDQFGRRESLNDPDKGLWKYTYNNLGELITQENAKGETSCMAYDTLGRMVKRIDNYSGNAVNAIDQCAEDGSNPETAYWVFDTAPGSSLGKLHQVVDSDGYVETHEYDSYGRPDFMQQTANGEQFAVDTSYDYLHRVKTTTYPGASNRLGITNVYNNLGFVVELANASNDRRYYQATAMDARGNITGDTLGNGLSVVRGYEASTGRLGNISTYNFFDGAGNPTIQSLDLTFDPLGNLTAREDNIENISESFSYDGLNRLLNTSSDFGNGDIRTTSVSYDSLGNIVSKTGVGSYSYGASCDGQQAGPHAVSSITSPKSTSYCYDANGNMVSGDGRTISYTSFDKPSMITRGVNSTQLRYNPSRNLYYREDANSAGITKTTFVGGLYEQVIASDNSTEERHYVGGFGIVSFKNRTENEAGTILERYLHKDHLGSTTAITNPYRLSAGRFSFDPWGKRRAFNLAILEELLGDWNTLDDFEKNNQTIGADLLASTVTNRGFTGHEQLDGVGLIHMGGRVYDAEIGRFISADPLIRNGMDLQALNRYSYVENNPLSYTDPSGYSLKSILKKATKTLKKFSPEYQLAKKTQNEVLRAHFRVHDFNAKNSKFVASADKYLADHQWAQQVVMAVATYYGGPEGAAAASMHIAHAQGAGVNSVRRAGAKAYLASAASSAVSGYYGSTYNMERVMVQSTVDGVVARTNGGAFMDGFKMSFAIGTVDVIAMEMRRDMVAQSKLAPANLNGISNESGISVGYRGDGFKLGGGRCVTVFGHCGKSPLGGQQGGPGWIGVPGTDVGFSYVSGSVMDHVVEAYAGPHDFLNSGVWYNSIGNAKILTGAKGFLGEAFNFANIAVATPIVAVSVVAPHTTSIAMYND